MRSSASQLRTVVPILLTLGAIGVCATGVWLQAAAPIPEVVSSPEPLPAPPPALREGVNQPHYIGSGSCAARACHGSPTLSPGREWNSAYAVWAANDPHAQAYSVLFTPESKRMAAALGLGDASKSDRCLACHSLPVAGSAEPSTLGRGQGEGAANAANTLTPGLSPGERENLLSDGVGCEVCHGPAENYLAAHTMRGWQQLGPARFEPKFGMQNTQEIASRAQICAGCHVGQPDAKGRPWRDVNHDLIAAGHPRLNFEFSAYMATLPPHWNTQKDKGRFDELRSWIAGQLATSEAALRLIEARAKAAEKVGDTDSNHQKTVVPPTWPELSEYDCFACHHGLSGKSWRQDLNAADVAKIHQGLDLNARPNMADRPQRKSGAPAWGTWYFEGPRLLAATPDVAFESAGKGFVTALNDLTTSMQTPLPDTGNVAVQAGKCLRSLKELELSTIQRGLTGLRLPDDATQRSGLVKSLATQFHERKPESWDEFVQDYLALVAIHRSAIDAEKSANAAAAARNKQMTEVLETIRNRLSFPAEPMASGAPAPAPNLRVLRSGINSPEQFDPYFKPSATALGELTGKNLFELFDEAFRLLSASGSAS